MPRRTRRPWPRRTEPGRWGALVAALALGACSNDADTAALPDPSAAAPVVTAQPAQGSFGPHQGPVPGAARAAALAVRVVDATGAPLAGRTVHVFSERGGPLASETSGADGAARFGELPAGLVLALFEREPPYASALAAGFLTAGGQHELELALGPGGELAGRVVDDLGAPVAGAALFLEQPARGGMRRAGFARVAESDADGRFRVSAVQSLPSGVWLVDGALRATDWRPVLVEARRAGNAAAGTRHVLAGARETLPQLVLERPACLTGRVLDAAGRPLPGVLVSAHPVRTRLVDGNLRVLEPERYEPALSIAPGVAGFTLLEGEVLTDAEGRYELCHKSARRRLLVWAPSGHLEAFPEPRLAAGEVRDHDLVLAERCYVRARLLDRAGRPIDGVPPEEEGVFLFPFHHPRQGLWARADAVLVATLADGRRLEAYAAGDASGAFLFQPGAPCERIAALEVLASGFEAAEERELARPLAEPRSYTLAPLPRLTLSVGLVPGTSDPSPAAGAQMFNLRACLAPPERGGDSVGDVACCGLGVRAQVVLTEVARRVELPVPSREPYWIYADNVRGGTREALVRGPFRADEGVIEFLLPRLAAAAPGGQAPAPPPAAQPSNPATGSLSFVATRAADGAPLAGVAFELRIDPRSSLRVAPRFVRSGDDGRVTVPDHAAGPWLLRLSEPGYELFTTIEFVQPLEPLDLGAVRLTPLPTLVLDLRSADGTPLEEEHELRARAPGGSVRWLRLGPEVREGGHWRLNGEATTGSVLHIGVALANDPDGLRAAAQEHVLGAPDEDGVVHVQLAPWRRVELRVAGLAPAHARTSMALDIGHAADDPVFGCGHPPAGHYASCIFARAEELAPAPDGARRFRTLLYPGAWRVGLRHALYDLVDERFTVSPGDGIQVVELRVR